MITLHLQLGYRNVEVMVEAETPLIAKERVAPFLRPEVVAEHRESPAEAAK